MKSVYRLAALIGAAFVLCALWLFSQPALAQGKFPNKPVRVVVPYAAGGFPDTVARIIGQKLGDRWGQQVLIDNRPGGNGVVSAQYVMSAVADGYTLLVTDNSMIAINPSLYPKLPYDAKKDFIPVSMMARAPLYMVINPSIPANTLQEFIALVKANPGKYAYGSSGIGSTHHLCMESFKTTLGLNMVHVPFKGTAQSVPAVVSGDVAVTLSAGPSVLGFAKSGKLKMIAVNSLHRASLSPELPTIAEVAIPGFNFAPTIGAYAPAGTPPEVVKQISADIAQVVKMAAVIENMHTLGIDPVGSTPEEYAAALKEDSERYAKVVKTANVKME
ncbi:MAG: tripartite tricarboxylate transporter substrate binding protein [Betaproteobacteria bacterium]|nr:tripartite tricarboxylate transporter substrate binding protein [Betaproteobacteria bacterium]